MIDYCHGQRASKSLLVTTRISSSVVKICSGAGALIPSLLLRCQSLFTRCLASRTDAVYLYAVAGGYHLVGVVNLRRPRLKRLGSCLVRNRGAVPSPALEEQVGHTEELPQ